MTFQEQLSKLRLQRPSMPKLPSFGMTNKIALLAISGSLIWFAVYLVYIR